MTFLNIFKFDLIFGVEKAQLKISHFKLLKFSSKFGPFFQIDLKLSEVIGLCSRVTVHTKE